MEADDNGTIVVTSPDLGIVTFGDDEHDARIHAVDALTAIIESMMSAREPIPMPIFDMSSAGPVLTLSLQAELKVLLHNAMIDADLTRAGLMRKLDWPRESVDRLFRLDHNSRLDQIESAFKALNRKVSVEVQEAA